MTTTTLETERLDALVEQMEILVEDARRHRELMDSISELAGDLSPIATQSLDSMTTALARAEERGYIGFARSGLSVVDRVVASFTEEDVEALGDNVVLILETIKEMTQPEIMEMTRSTFRNVHEVDIPDEPPSLFALLRQFRDPDVRRGMARVTGLLKSLGSTTSQTRKEAQR